MQKKTLPYVEDYIEILAGYTGIRGKNMQFSLARYDVQIVSSLAEQTNRGVGYTDRQALLAHKLLVKYKRQFAKYNIDVGFHEENAHYRISIRFVDRRRQITIEDNQLKLKFPYDSSMIDALRESGKNVNGSIRFDKDQKAWISSITEPRLVWAQSVAEKYQFEVDPSFTDLINQVEECRHRGYLIQLQKNNSLLEITNADNSLNSYIEEHLGGFGLDNLTKLIDYSDILGYTVADELLDSVDESNVNQRMLLSKREIHLPITNNSALTDIVLYAERTNRWPIFIYENNDVNDVKIKPFLSKYFKNENILIPSLRQQELKTEGYQCVYLNNWNMNWDNRIPLLVTMTSLMVGPKKQHILQVSDKVVYCTDVILKYTPNT